MYIRGNDLGCRIFFDLQHQGLSHWEAVVYLVDPMPRASPWLVCQEKSMPSLRSEHSREVVIVISIDLVYQLGRQVYWPCLLPTKKEDVGRMVEPPRPAGCSDLYPCCQQASWSGKEGAEGVARSEVAAVLFVGIKWKRYYLKASRSWVLFIPPHHQIKLKMTTECAFMPSGYNT